MNFSEKLLYSAHGERSGGSQLPSGLRRVMPSNQEELPTLRLPDLGGKMPEKNEEAQEILAIREHLLTPGAYKIVDASQLENIPTECPDGRNEHCSIFEFGGKGAAQIRLIRAAERTLGREFSSDEIKKYMKALVQEQGGSYFHFDDHFVDALAVGYFGINKADLQGDQRLEMVSRLQRPSDADKQRIKDLIRQLPAKHFGCGHLGLMKDNAEAFDLREGFLMSAYEALLESAWSLNAGGKEQVVMHLMHDEHEEKAILLVSSKISNKIVLTRPNINGDEYFIATPELAATLREKSLSAVQKIWSGMDMEEYKRELAAVAKMQDEATLALLGAARNKKIYTVDFYEKDGQIDVNIQYLAVNQAIAA